jgi:hypothetical protein
MRKVYVFGFLFYSIAFFSQKITLKVLDYNTNLPIEKAPIFFNEKANFSFPLKNKKSISFSITHLNYETKKIVYKKGVTPDIIFLKEKQETLVGIEISSKRNFKAAIDFKKLLDLPKSVDAFASVINEDKIYVFGGDTSSEYDKNKEGLSQIQYSSEREILQFLQKPKPSSFYNFLGDIQSCDISNKR